MLEGKTIAMNTEVDKIKCKFDLYVDLYDKLCHECDLLILEIKEKDHIIQLLEDNYLNLKNRFNTEY